MGDTKTIYFKGTLKSTYNHEDKDDNGNVVKSSNIISVFSEDLEGFDADGKVFDVTDFFNTFYKGKTAKWVPDWYKEKKDFITLKSSYNVPVKVVTEDKQMSFAEWVERGEIRGAVVTIKCNVKESAIYPNAMLVHQVGEPYDAFAEF